MRFHFSILATCVLMGVSSCGPVPSSHSSRSANTAFAFAEQGVKMDAQARALSALSRRIVAQTTMKGAGIGAAMGCSLVLVSSGSAKNCVAGAAKGALGGAVIGHVSGKQKVAREIEAISPSAVVRTLRKTNAQMALVQTSLPARLAAQEEALASLDMQRATGAVSATRYAQARAAIAAERQSIAAALIETQSNATLAATNLKAARNKGQSGLDWHIGASDNLAAQASSARSSISLL